MAHAFLIVEIKMYKLSTQELSTRSRRFLNLFSVIDCVYIVSDSLPYLHRE